MIKNMKACENCECMEHCFESGYCVADELNKRFTADEQWDDEEEKEELNVPELNPEPDVPEVDVPDDILKAAIKG